MAFPFHIKTVLAGRRESVVANGLYPLPQNDRNVKQNITMLHDMQACIDTPTAN